MTDHKKHDLTTTIESQVEQARIGVSVAPLVRSPLFEGLNEYGDSVQIVMASVIATFRTGQYLQVYMPGFAVRFPLAEAERFRTALRDWL